jgi:hypothetical protein
VAEENSWEEFLRGAAFLRNNPRFDAEERDRKLDLAGRLRRFLERVQRGSSFGPDFEDLVLALCDPGWPCTPVVPFHAEWLKAWASSDEASLREALEAFSRRDEDPVSRFRHFSDKGARAAVAGTIVGGARFFLTYGSLFNFSLEPRTLPIVPPAAFEAVEQRLWWTNKDASAVAGYEHHLAFARKVGNEMRNAGIRVEDMLDVESAIHMAGRHPEIFWEYWAPMAPAPRAPAQPRRPPRARRRVAPYYLSVAACLGYDTQYLLEWLEFHRLVGVEHFYLYNNGDKAAQRDLLTPYVEEGIVTLYEWDVIPPQIAAYEHCVENHSEESRWIAIIDTDEFVFSPTGRPLPDLLIDYERWPAVGVNWATFGPSGHHAKPSGLVIESYVLRASNSGLGIYGKNHVRLIVDPTQVQRCIGPHEFYYEDGDAVDENQYPLLGPYTPYVSTSQLQINHYFTRSVTEFRTKLARPRPDSGAPRPEVSIEQILSNEKAYARRDDAILQYVPVLRRALATRPARRPAA